MEFNFAVFDVSNSKMFRYNMKEVSINKIFKMMLKNLKSYDNSTDYHHSARA